MILLFDLDDTLYSEITYVHSGLAAVSSYLSDKHSLSQDIVYSSLSRILQRDGRGKLFDTHLDSLGLLSMRAVRECISIYRSHTPDITLYEETDGVLQALDRFPHYLVTDGNKMVQQKKVSALGIGDRFRRVFITHRFGLKHAKPSTHCFEIVRQSERVNWSEMVYVGDNPNKDFVNLNKAGALTVRVRTGSFANVEAEQGFDAQYSIDDIGQLPALFRDNSILQRVGPRTLQR